MFSPYFCYPLLGWEQLQMLILSEMESFPLIHCVTLHILLKISQHSLLWRMSWILRYKCPLLQVLQDQEHDQKHGFKYQLYFHITAVLTASKCLPLPMHKCTSYNFSKLTQFLHFSRYRYSGPEIGIRFKYHWVNLWIDVIFKSNILLHPGEWPLSHHFIIVARSNQIYISQDILALIG